MAIFGWFGGKKAAGGRARVDPRRERLDALRAALKEVDGAAAPLAGELPIARLRADPPFQVVAPAAMPGRDVGEALVARVNKQRDEARAAKDQRRADGAGVKPNRFAAAAWRERRPVAAGDRRAFDRLPAIRPVFLSPPQRAGGERDDRPGHGEG